jgi:hypothetical protein
MELDSYSCLIANLPVLQQAFTSKKSTWEDRVHPMPDVLANIFGADTTATISRADLFRMAEANGISRLVYGVILWGYSRGTRGRNFQTLVAEMGQLEAVILSIKNNGNQIPDWEQHWTEARGKGTGLSTYSKILYFMRTLVNGKRCLILDQVLIDVFGSGKFDEFASLRTITYRNAPSLYPNYLDLMDREASRLGATADQLEMFLFMFGPILTPETPNN